MDRGRKRLSYVAAFLLATVTLFVFWVLQDYGPESAIRRFHRAVAEKKLGDLQAVSQQSVDSNAMRVLVSRVVELGESGARPRLLNVQRRPREVVAEVLYAFPNGQAVSMLWVVDKRDRNWKVDAYKTLVAARDAMGF